MTSPRVTTFASSSSPRRARPAPSRSARESRRPRLARPWGLTVAEIKAAHDDLVSRGVEASEMWHGAPFPPEARLSGPDPERTSYGSFFSFNDPDGNAWLIQEVTTRLPGRV
jgi:hypothetical protein